MKREVALQRLCRALLFKARDIAKRHGLGGWLNDVLLANRRGECKATEEEVDMLSRLVGEERICQNEIAPLLGVSYRTFFEQELMKKVRKFKRLGTYSRNDAILLKETEYTDENNPSLFEDENRTD